MARRPLPLVMGCGQQEREENWKNIWGKQFSFPYMHEGFMSIKSFKIPQGKPGFVFSIQCQERRQKATTSSME